jgi:hypothetical protein
VLLDMRDQLRQSFLTFPNYSDISAMSEELFTVVRYFRATDDNTTTERLASVDHAEDLRSGHHVHIDTYK